MITGELKRQVDKIWDTLWTAGITSPVTVMEQITYLLFMKLLDDNQLVRESNANAFGTAVQDPVFKEGKCVIFEQPLIACDYERLRHEHHRSEKYGLILAETTSNRGAQW